jgi:hypothetical protein
MTSGVTFQVQIIYIEINQSNSVCNFGFIVPGAWPLFLFIMRSTADINCYLTLYKAFPYTFAVKLYFSSPWRSLIAILLCWEKKYFKTAQELETCDTSKCVLINRFSQIESSVLVGCFHCCIEISLLPEFLNCSL